MDYKKILKSQSLRFKILNLLSWVPDKIMLKIQYKIKTGRKLNLKNPKRFTEKIQWYKLNYRNPLMKQCVDKYEVRNYIKYKSEGTILNKLYGVYNNPDEINFDKLPKNFVIKTTSGSGGQNIIICDDKQKLDIKKTKLILKKWLKLNPKKSFGREWAYQETKNKIIIEKKLEGNNENLSGINDFKFFCYHGKVKYIVFDGDRYIKHKRAFFNEKWEYLNIQSDCDKLDNIVSKPKKLNEMIRIAEKLSDDFPFVRVDLYNIKEQIFFGEMTFYPWAGYVKFQPDEFDYILGENLDIKKIKGE